MQGNYFTGFIGHLNFINNGREFENNYCNIYNKELELSI